MDFKFNKKIYFKILKMFFGDMRKFGGCNRKPDCLLFEAGLRKVLADKNISHSKYGNCTVINHVSEYYPYSNVGVISSDRPKKATYENNMYSEDEVQEVLNDLFEINEDRSKLLDLSDRNTAYVASTIELKILNDKSYMCCQNVFSENEKLQNAFTSKHHLSIACKSTFEICMAADYFLKLDILKGQFSINLISQSIIESLNIDNLYENTDFEMHAHDKLSLIKQILLRYIQYKGNLLSKSVTDIKKYQEKMQQRREIAI